jgi:hypothetical protein
MEGVIRELEEGLILRHAHADDIERLVAFNGKIHGENELEQRIVGAWTRDLMSGIHPTFKVDDFLVVEDPQQARIVSSLNLISQTWTYDGIPFTVGRIELVGTDPEYRRRGLVSLQFDEIHRMSQERGELVQAITGIPFYYRQFGYEMALSLHGGRIGYETNVPVLPAEETEPFEIRPATEADLPFISRLYELDAQRSLVSSSWTPDMWRYELLGKGADNVDRLELRIITDHQKKPVGFLSHPPRVWPNSMPMMAYCIDPCVSWWEVTPSVMRYMLASGKEYGKPQGRDCAAIYFILGEEHPVYTIFSHRLPRSIPAYAYYLRVPDLAAFLRLITPVLEKRLEERVRPGYNGELRIGFYRSGIGLKFDQGKLSEIQNLGPAELQEVMAGFPSLTFLQILFGYKSLDELRRAFPDCWVNEDKARPLIEALFPRKYSNVWAIS